MSLEKIEARDASAREEFVIRKTYLGSVEEQRLTDGAAALRQYKIGVDLAREQDVSVRITFERHRVATISQWSRNSSDLDLALALAESDR